MQRPPTVLMQSQWCQLQLHAHRTPTHSTACLTLPLRRHTPFPYGTPPPLAALHPLGESTPPATCPLPPPPTARQRGSRVGSAYEGQSRYSATCLLSSKTQSAVTESCTLEWPVVWQFMLSSRVACALTHCCMMEWPFIEHSMPKQQSELCTKHKQLIKVTTRADPTMVTAWVQQTRRRQPEHLWELVRP